MTTPRTHKISNVVKACERLRTVPGVRRVEEAGRVRKANEYEYYSQALASTLLGFVECASFYIFLFLTY
jgi:hypothetical protein